MVYLRRNKEDRRAPHRALRKNIKKYESKNTEPCPKGQGVSIHHSDFLFSLKINPLKLKLTAMPLAEVAKPEVD